MPKINVTYYDIEGEEMECQVRADDEAAALGVVLDELGDTIASDSPFALWRETVPRRKAMGPSKPGSRGKLLVGPYPSPVDDNDADEANEDEDGLDLQPLPDDVIDGSCNDAVAGLIASLKNDLGVGAVSS